MSANHAPKLVGQDQPAALPPEVRQFLATLAIIARRLASTKSTPAADTAGKCEIGGCGNAAADSPSI
jgi:hypothetical protein